MLLILLIFHSQIHSFSLLYLSLQFSVFKYKFSTTSKWMISILWSQKSELMLPIISINITFFLVQSQFLFKHYDLQSSNGGFSAGVSPASPSYYYGFHQGFFLHILSLHLNFKAYFKSQQLHIFIFKEGNISIKVIRNGSLLLTIAQHDLLSLHSDILAILMSIYFADHILNSYYSIQAIKSSLQFTSKPNNDLTWPPS